MANCSPNSVFVERMNSIFYEWGVTDVGLRYDENLGIPYTKPLTYVELIGVYKDSAENGRVSCEMNIKEGEQIQWGNNGNIFIADHKCITEYVKVS